MSPTANVAESTGATVQSWPESIFPFIELPRGRNETVSPRCNRAIWPLAQPIAFALTSAQDILHDLIVPHGAVKVGERRHGSRLDDSLSDIVACERADCIHRGPARQHEKLHAFSLVPSEQGDTEKALDALQVRQHPPLEVIAVGGSIRRQGVATPRSHDHWCPPLCRSRAGFDRLAASISLRVARRTLTH